MIYRSSYKKQSNYRISLYDDNQNGEFDFVLVSLILDAFSRSFGMILIRISLYTWSIFSKFKEKSFYRKMLLWGFGIGIPLSMIGLALSYLFGWNWRYSQFLGQIPNTIATPLIAIAYIGTIMIWSRKAFLQFVKTGLESVGRTTLTCYLIRSILSIFVFYGFGLGLYGYVNRFEQVLIVLSIWIFILIFVSRWLQKFQYRPIE